MRKTCSASVTGCQSWLNHKVTPASETCPAKNQPLGSSPLPESVFNQFGGKRAIQIDTACNVPVKGKRRHKTELNQRWKDSIMQALEVLSMPDIDAEVNE